MARAIAVSISGPHGAPDVEVDVIEHVLRHRHDDRELVDRDRLGRQAAVVVCFMPVSPVTQ
jgi:hypothetical protein